LINVGDKVQIRAKSEGQVASGSAFVKNIQIDPYAQEIWIMLETTMDNGESDTIRITAERFFEVLVK
jgi:predicted nucleic acid-binding protein